MSRFFYLFAEQPERVRPFFPLSHGLSRAGDLGAPGGIIYVMASGMARNGRRLPVGMALIKPCITAFFAGVAWMYSKHP